jgi:hypothetical protein
MWEVTARAGGSVLTLCGRQQSMHSSQLTSAAAAANDRTASAACAASTAIAWERLRRSRRVQQSLIEQSLDERTSTSRSN